MMAIARAAASQPGGMPPIPASYAQLSQRLQYTAPVPGRIADQVGLVQSHKTAGIPRNPAFAQLNADMPKPVRPPTPAGGGGLLTQNTGSPPQMGPQPKSPSPASSPPDSSTMGPTRTPTKGGGGFLGY